MIFFLLTEPALSPAIVLWFKLEVYYFKLVSENLYSGYFRYSSSFDLDMKLFFYLPISYIYQKVNYYLGKLGKLLFAAELGTSYHLFVLLSITRFLLMVFIAAMLL